MRRPVVAVPSLLLCLTGALRAQCPDGTPPPCGPRRPPPPPPPPPAYRQLTTSGNVDLATLSPDGKFLAYAENGVLLIRNVAEGGRPVEVSRDRTRWSWGVQWFPDATRLLVLGDSGTYVIPSLGGASRSMRVWSHQSRLSPDGRRVAFWAELSKSVYVADAETGGLLDSVPIPGTYRWLSAVDWSPDSRYLTATTSDGARRYTMRTVSTTNRVSHVVVADSARLANPRWDARSPVIYYLRIVGQAPQLWKVPVSPSTGATTGPPTIVMPLLETITQPLPSQGLGFDVVESGQDLAFLRVRISSNIWIGGTGSDTTRRWLTSGSAINSDPRLSPDGKMVAFAQGDPTNANVFVVGSDSGPATQLTFLHDRRVMSLAWSPSGRQIAYCTVGEASSQVGVVTLSGTPVAVPTASALADDCEVSWATDDEILYRRVGNRNFAVLSQSGDPERLLVTNDSVGWMFNPVVDASGGRVAVFWNRPRDGRQAIWLISRRDSSQRRLATGFVRPLRWASDGQTLYVWHDGRLARLNVSRPDSLEVTASPPCPGAFDVTSDGSRMVCAEFREPSDVWLIRNFDPTAPARPPASRP